MFRNLYLSSGCGHTDIGIFILWSPRLATMFQAEEKEGKTKLGVCLVQHGLVNGVRSTTMLVVFNPASALRTEDAVL